MQLSQGILRLVLIQKKFGLLLRVAANCIRNSIETKAENNRQKYP
jgi:hypothetical protein